MIRVSLLFCRSWFFLFVIVISGCGVAMSGEAFI
jgi:hypothetical protein